MTGYLGSSTTSSFPVPAANPLFSTSLSFGQSATDANNHGVATVTSWSTSRSRRCRFTPATAWLTMLADGQLSKGLELGLSGKLTPAWSVMGGYAYQDATLTADVSATARKGATLAQVPDHALSLWNRFEFSPALAAAIGAVYRGAIFPSTSNVVILPSYTRFDGVLFYNIDQHCKLQLNVENVFDKKYYTSAHSDSNIMPGAPRTLRLTLNATF
jgi:catecholate siderophore receptor